jgi:hypothetical protein
MVVLKCAAGLFLVILLGIVGWVLTHLRRIKREMIANEAMPRPGPGANILLLLCVVIFALCSLLVAFLIH